MRSKRWSERGVSAISRAARIALRRFSSLSAIRLLMNSATSSSVAACTTPRSALNMSFAEAKRFAGSFAMACITTVSSAGL